MKIAICSINYNKYSETFIQAHKVLLKGEVLFYNTGWIPTRLETKLLFSSRFFLLRALRNILRNFRLLKYSDVELGFYNSLIQNKPDVILAEYAVCGAEILTIVKRLKIPMVIHCHGFDVSEFSITNQYREKYSEAFEYAVSVIGVSKKMCQMIEALGCQKQKIVYSCCGPKIEFFNINPNYSGAYALAVGRFVEKKGPELTIMAFKKVLDTFPTARLNFVGEGELLDRCKKTAKDLQIDHAVSFHGSLIPFEIMHLMQSASFFVQHSMQAKNGDMEGTPVAILEAQAAGLPVVSTYHAGIPDVVIHNTTGLLSNEGDINAMANNMINLFKNKALCERLGRNARERIKNYFTMEQHIDTLQSALNGAANK